MATWNPIAYWRDWWASLTLAERLVVVGIAISVACIIFISPAWAADGTDGMQAIWLALIAAVPLALSGPFIAWLNERSRRRDRAEDRAERDTIAERQRLAAERTEHIAAAIATVAADVARVEVNTNSMSSRNEAIAEKLGVAKGMETQKIISEDLAAKLAIGQKQGADTERARGDATAAVPTVTSLPRGE